MECCKPSDPARRTSKLIDKKIAAWMKEYCRTIKILLLGAGESGKTTIIKQMKIIHIQGFSDSERQEKIKDIRRNILEAIKELTGNMAYIKPPIDLNNPDLQDSLGYIQSLNMVEEYDFPQEFFDHTELLWRDLGIQECYSRSNEFNLIDSAKYFLDRINTIRQVDYMPSDQDILCCRKRTNEIQKIEFTIKVPKKYGGGKQAFWMFDVGGQRGERKKWIQVFDGIAAVLFLVSSSGFDMKLREDQETNRLTEALQLFEDVWYSRFLRDAGFIVFLNKQDILKEKIERGVKLQKYFPEYSNYTVNPADGDGTDDYQKARCFIRDKFMEVTKKVEAPRRFSTSEMYYDIHKDLKKRECFWHFTVATDTNNIKTVFNDIHTMIILWNLEKITPN
ncbi:guanine nucleotide-binding protein G(s) subunit alpha-like [Centruroides sculpturatus]|uniref:guanine nucleotide-binding protein G(s) subunit alpha-like n=1 Tax=Centruroides sculpturatus TaxID=218467 RepID=UPI000C6EE934|nr:guanine nucleotide-binding protein G(s) subunit alpha-like [Centruroides sculpturatus]